MSGPLLDAEALARLRGAAEALGLLRLGAVDLEHPGFRPAVAAYERFLAADKAGEMDFLVRTREVRSAPASMLPGARTLLVACVPYRGEAGPIARYAQSLDYHTEIHRRLEALAAALAREVPGATSLVCVDTKPVLERSAAMLAGLGFLGKHGCLIVPGLGSYVLLGALLTTAACEGSAGLAADALPAAPWDACGSCRRCLDACPTAAFDGPGDLDVRVADDVDGVTTVVTVDVNGVTVQTARVTGMHGLAGALALEQHHEGSLVQFGTIETVTSDAR